MRKSCACARRPRSFSPGAAVPGPPTDREPTAAYLKANAGELGGRKLCNPWTWGGYLGWALNPDYLVFMPENKWALIYWDAFSVLFARRVKPVAAEFKIIRPDDFENVKVDLCGGGVAKKAAEAELRLYYAAAAGARSTRG